MENLIKEFFNSDVCEYNHFKMPSREKANAEKESEALIEKIKEHMTPKDLELLENYDEHCSIVNNEDAYHAFVCGIKITLQVLTEMIRDS